MANLESLFKELYQSNYSKVYRLCLGYMKGDAMLASELSQEVFIKVWENLYSFRQESAASTWIYRITVNTCLIHLRKKKEISISKVLNTIEAESEEDLIHENTEQNLRNLYACIDTLNKENKSIILLELEGIPQKEIADIMGLNHDAIRVRIHRIKNELTKCVQK
tara:strand:- start:13 stop:507 length:495 start_codon:yes stop_codon:yes gene_type:complete